MADTYKKLFQAQAAASVATIATATNTWIIRHIRVVNTHASPQTIELWDDGTADVNKILGATTIGPDETYTEDCFIVVANGDTIAAEASVASEVTVTAYGVEIT